MPAAETRLSLCSTELKAEMRSSIPSASILMSCYEHCSSVSVWREHNSCVQYNWQALNAYALNGEGNRKGGSFSLHTRSLAFGKEQSKDTEHRIDKARYAEDLVYPQHASYSRPERG